MRVNRMKPSDLKSLSVDELWSLHELVASVLAHKISAEKGRLDQRLRQLSQGALMSAKRTSRAPSVPASGSEVSQSRATVRDLGGPGQTAALVDRTAQVRKKPRRFPDSAAVGSCAQGRLINLRNRIKLAGY